jgi:hypothetical protein
MKGIHSQQSQSQAWPVGEYLSPGSSRVPEKLSLSSLDGSHLVPMRWMIAPAPGCTLIVMGNCPHLEDSPARLHCSLGEVSVPCHKDVIHHSCPSLIPRWLQERMAQSKGQRIQNGGRKAKLFSCV